MGQKHVWRGLRLLAILPATVLGFVVFSGTTSSKETSSGGTSSSGKENLDLPFDAIGENEEEEIAPEIVVFYGQIYEADALFFALDESGSMQQQGRWSLQSREILRAILELTSRTEFGLVFYASRVTAFREQPVTATEGMKNAARSFIQSRQPDGDTCLAEGAVKALQIAAKSKSRHRAVIVTSDGKPDICSTGELASGEEFNALIQKTLDANPGRQVKLHTVWVGAVIETQAIEVMKRLAAAHGGTFRQVHQ
jgi:Mg-chelatase subunit ChlD